jgi:purine-binding chemotaxis protein CheW
MLEVALRSAANEKRRKPVETLGTTFVTFRLSGEIYGVEILVVREMVGVQVLGLPDGSSADGALNLNGKVVKVLDLRPTFGLEPTGVGATKAIIVVEVEESGRRQCVGIYADEMTGIVSFDDSSIEPPQLADGVGHLPFILGLGYVDTKMVFLLDIAKVIAHEKLGEMSHALPV